MKFEFKPLMYNIYAVDIKIKYNKDTHYILEAELKPIRLNDKDLSRFNPDLTTRLIWKNIGEFDSLESVIDYLSENPAPLDTNFPKDKKSFSKLHSKLVNHIYVERNPRPLEREEMNKIRKQIPIYNISSSY